MIVLAAITFVAYTLSPHMVEFFGTDRLVYVASFVAIGVVRFLTLALWRTDGEPPTDAMLRDQWSCSTSLPRLRRRST